MAVNTQLNTATVPLAIFKNTINISSAQILAMYATPVLIVPSPGANKFIFVHDAFVEYARGTTSYANGSGISFQYGNAGSDTSGTIFMSSNISIIGAASDFGGDPVTPFSTFGSLSDWVNQGVYVGTSVNSFTAGDGTLRIEIFYTVVTTTA
jgi:hypothetical protein